MTWPESVDAALCFGWIDGVRRRRDDASYTIRFTPRRAGSIWSAVNVAKAEALTSAGLMTPAGLAAFAARREDRTAVYSHEQGGDEALAFTAAEQERLKSAPGAWEYLDRPARLVPAGRRALAALRRPPGDPRPAAGAARRRERGRAGTSPSSVGADPTPTARRPRTGRFGAFDVWCGSS